MTYTNFKLDVDADGIALVTWDMPGRSMNVIDQKVTEEIKDIVEKVATDAAIKGAVITSAKEAFCAGADLTMLDTMATTFGSLVKQQGEEAATTFLFEESRKLSLILTKTGNLGQAVGRGDQRHRARRRVRDHARLPSSGGGGQSEDPGGRAGDQGRAVSRRRRHPAHPAHDPGERGAAGAAQGRPDPARPRQGDEARRRGGAGGRSRQGGQGLDQGGRQGEAAVGRSTATGCPAARSSPRAG